MVNPPALWSESEDKSDKHILVRLSAAPHDCAGVDASGQRNGAPTALAFNAGSAERVGHRPDACRTSIVVTGACLSLSMDPKSIPPSPISTVIV